MGTIMYMDKEYAGSYAGLIDFFYPVGCYFHTSNASFDPNVEWGGTWTLLGEGKVLLSGSKSGSYIVGNTYGGNTKSYTPSGSVSVTVSDHTLNTNEIPSHGHIGNDVSIKYYTGSATNTRGTASWGWGDGNLSWFIGNSGSSWAHSHGGSGSFSGTAATLNVMQSSEATYIWHRIA